MSKDAEKADDRQSYLAVYRPVPAAGLLNEASLPGEAPPNLRAFAFRQGVAWQFAAVVTVLLLVGIVIRLSCARDSLWIDEVASLHFATEPLSNLWSDWMRRETNPPLYYSALKGWMLLTGSQSDQTLRLLSLAYGCGAMLVAGALARKIAGLWAAIAVVALMAVSPAQVHYGVEIRAFAQAQFAALLTLLGAYHFFSATGAIERRTGLALYVASCIAAIHSHTILVLLPMLVNAWALFWLAGRARTEAPRWLSWIGANLLVLVASLWWLSITLWQVRNASNLDWIDAPTLSDAARQLLIIYGPGSPDLFPPAMQGLVELVATAIGIVGLGAMIWTYRRDPALLLPICAIGVPCILFLVSLVKPVMIPRAFFWAGGTLLLSVAIGLSLIPNRKIATALLGLLLALNLAGSLTMVGRGDGEPFRQIVVDLSRRDPGAIVIADGMETGLALRRYCRQIDCALRINAVEGRESWTAGIAMPRIAAADIPDILAQAGKIYTVQRPFGPEKTYVPADRGVLRDLSRRYGPASYLRVAQLDLIPSGRATRPRMASSTGAHRQQ